MPNRREILMAGTATFLGCCGCRSAPVTGRPQLKLIPTSLELQLGQQSFNEVVQSVPASQNAHWQQIVSRVGQRIAAEANQPKFQWDFRLLADQTQNAFCLPGGKVAIYEGIIPACQNEAGLAVVMSHEIAHAIAHHGAERMSQQAGVSGVSTMLGWMMNDVTPATKQLAMQAFGTGARYGLLLPYSRKHETEADEIGLMLMAKAGYDPSEAPLFWGRFAQAGSSNTPEWASTHPSDDRRATELTAKLPTAHSLYESSPYRFGKGETLV